MGSGGAIPRRQKEKGQSTMIVEPLAEITYCHGGYRMTVQYYDSNAQVTMYDLSNLRFPLVWSKTMTKAAARGASAIFESIGYFDCPVDVEHIPAAV